LQRLVEQRLESKGERAQQNECDIGIPIAFLLSFPIAITGPKGHRRDLERWTTMSQRESNLLWLKDILEHMMHCQEQLEWTEDEETVQVLTETMLRDLESCRRLLGETIRRRRDWATPAAV